MHALYRSLLAGLSAPAAAIVLTAAVPVITPGVGMRAPALHAVTDAGRPVGYKDVMGQRGLVLVFFRSAKWCPFCQHQLIDLQNAQSEIEKRGYKLAAISYDDPQVLAEFRAKRGIGYTLLSDHGSRMIDAFALRDPQYPPDSFAYGVPHPTIYVIGRDARVEARLSQDGYKVRPTNDAILAELDKIAPAS